MEILKRLGADPQQPGQKADMCQCAGTLAYPHPCNTEDKVVQYPH